MIDYLEHIDQQLLLLINGFNNPFFDKVMWVISDAYFGIPFYLLFFFIAIRFFGVKKAMLIILVGAIAVGLADLASKHFFKEVFLRYRPSHNLLLSGKIHLVDEYKGGTYGFVSSHAANMFAIATCLGLYFYSFNKKLIFILFVWAALIAYSRMYLGVHYPSDIFVGGLLGTFIGFLGYKLTNKYILK